MKRRRSLVVLVAFLAIVAVAVPASAQDLYSERTIEIARRLQCPVCAGETVADSNSELARQMRDIIEQKVQAGERNEQIFQYFVDRYGQSILTEPPKSGFSLALWWFPVIALLVGALVVALYLRERTPHGGGRDARREMVDEDAELEALAREALEHRPVDRAARP